MSHHTTVDSGEERHFKRSVSNLGVFCLGFGSMIGFGWIVLTGGWISEAGAGGAALAFLIGGGMMALVGLVYGELASAMPLAGGEHNYLLRGFGPRLALLGSWGIIGGYVTVSMFQSVAVPRAVNYLFPDLSQIPMYSIGGEPVYLTWALVGTATAVVLTWMNIRGMKGSSLFQTSIIMFLLLVAVIMLISTLFAGKVENVQPVFANGSVGVVAVLVVVPFLFVGFDVIPQSAEEANVPPRQLGKLILISVLGATAFYIVIVLTTAFAAPADQISGFDLATGDALAYMLDNDVWGHLVIAGGLAGVITTWNAFMVGASRLMWAMASCGMIPKWFGRMHPTNGTPVNALLFLGIVTGVAPFFGLAMLDWAVDAGGPSIVITYFMVALVFLILRKREPDMERPMRVGRKGSTGVVVGVLAAAATAGMLVLYVPGLPAQMGAAPWIIFAAWWIAGVIFALRLPGGIAPGHDAEERLRVAIARRREGSRQS
ncbi:MAG TPA: APC family permease [Candidatus Nesterenkonia stercoripullorum]|uniref:APC family permease n=1 Tax=Candidatus Nesterenkonia stercoripullorum TaxID=2838701 RepID=A0A9D2A8U5_9MICC|nr:APC family permease [Candidatus Nesterenkonia stercoripullorum]